MGVVKYGGLGRICEIIDKLYNCEISNYCMSGFGKFLDS